MRAFEDLWQTRQPGSAPPKQVEVSVSGLILATQISRPLFDEVQKRQRFSQAMDRINLNGVLEGLCRLSSQLPPAYGEKFAFGASLAKRLRRRFHSI